MEWCGGTPQFSGLSLPGGSSAYIIASTSLCNVILRYKFDSICYSLYIHNHACYNIEIIKIPTFLFNVYKRFFVSSFTFLTVFRLDALALSVIATATCLAGWLAGWVSVTLPYCIKTAKPIRKLFRPSENPITLLFETAAPIQNSKGNPFSGGVKYMGVGKLVIFVRFLTYIAVYLGNGAR